MNKPFKISDLPEISNISDDDLFIVSDYDAEKCTSKKMTIEQLTSYIEGKIQPLIEELIDERIAEAISQLDIEPKVTKTLDRLDGVEDNVISVDAGSSK